MIVNGTPGFFPLSKIRPQLKDYYLNAAGEVFSTRQYATPRKMTGTEAPRGGRTYTFTPAPGSMNRLPTTIRGDVLFADAKRHADWTKDTAKTVDKPATVAMPAFGPSKLVSSAKDKKLAADNERDHVDLQTAIAGKGFIVGRVEGAALVFGSKPVPHATEKSAKAEVARLAASQPGKSFVYLQIQGAASFGGINWS